MADPLTTTSPAPRFRMGTLDHVHVMVPDREAAAIWYGKYLGFDPVDEYASWANDVDGGPLQISADDGRSMLALFEISDGHPGAPHQAGIAFSVDSAMITGFSRSLVDGGIDSPLGVPLTANDIVDFDLCWAYNLSDPWGNIFELNCYDYDTVRRNLVEADGLTPVRYWPRAST